MKFLRQYRFVLMVFLLMVVLVLFRSFGGNNFRYDAARWAESSVKGSNLLTVDQLSAMTGAVLVLNLGDEADLPGQLRPKTVIMRPESITGKENLRLIRKHRGPVILFSDDASTSARVWMILSEMGMRDVYILRDPGAVAE